MVFGIIGMVNFAHGDVFMVSAFIALIFLLASRRFWASDSGGGALHRA
jgi:branched-chain amino acid transport system permease protein